MWTCPKCGRQFVLRNVEHTCHLIRASEHLVGKGPKTRALYTRLERMTKKASGGRAVVTAFKTGIAIRGRVGFVFIRVLRERLDVGLLLPRVLRHPRVKKTFTQSQRSHVHYFDLRTTQDLNAEFAGWLRQAWTAGQQMQLSAPAAPHAAREIPESAPEPRRKVRLKERPLWRCPQCGKRYVTPNLSHSCRRIPESARLAGKSERVVWLYRRIVKTLRVMGPLLINPGKTGIAFQARMRFAGVVLRRANVELRFILRRRLESPRVTRTLSYGPHLFGHYVTVAGPEDLDAELQSWLAESYRVGTQQHLLRKSE